MYKIVFERPGVQNGSKIRRYLVTEAADLATLPSDTAPSSQAHTVGFGSVWEMGLDGTWHEIATGGSGSSAYILGSDNGLPFIEG